MSTLEPFHLTGPMANAFAEIALWEKIGRSSSSPASCPNAGATRARHWRSGVEENGWGFCCYDVRGFGDSEGRFIDYTLSDWIADARAVLDLIQERPAALLSWVIPSAAGSPGCWRKSVRKLKARSHCAGLQYDGPARKIDDPERSTNGIPPAGCPGTTTRCTGIGRCRGSGWRRAKPIG